MNIIDKIDNRLFEMRIPKGGLKDEAQWQAWLKFENERAKDKKAFRKKMEDKKFINRLKKKLGLRK